MLCAYVEGKKPSAAGAMSVQKEELEQRVQ